MNNGKSRIYLSPPHMSGMEEEYIKEAFASNWIAPLGPNVTGFEQAVCSFTGAGGAVALSSGTAAIHMALRLLEVGKGDRVFCSSLTFIGSVNPILYLGAEPVFIDSEPESWNMSPIALRKAFEWARNFGKMPRAVVIVDLYGESADYEVLLEICNEYGVPVVEDAAEALGAFYRGKACGTFGRFGVFSFNGNKIITTSGGGMLVSDDKDSLAKALFWATQARDPAPWYQHSEMGYNYRMSNIVAGIGRGQMKVLPERVEARRIIYQRYFEELGGMQGVDFMPEASFGRCNRWLTVMTLDPGKVSVKPLDLIQALERENIEARPLWKPMHLQPLFSNSPFFTDNDRDSVSDVLFARGLCLPSGSSMTEDDQGRVIDCLKQILI